MSESQWTEAEIIAVSETLSREWMYGASQMILGLAREGEEARAEVAQLKGELRDATVALLHCQTSRRAIAEHEEAHKKELAASRRELKEAGDYYEGLLSEEGITALKGELAEAHEAVATQNGVVLSAIKKAVAARAAALKEAEAIARRSANHHAEYLDGLSSIATSIADAIAALAKEPAQVRPSASRTPDGSTPLPGAGGEEDRALVPMAAVLAVIDQTISDCDQPSEAIAADVLDSVRKEIVGLASLPPPEAPARGRGSKQPGEVK